MRAERLVRCLALIRFRDTMGHTSVSG